VSAVGAGDVEGPLSEAAVGWAEPMYPGNVQASQGSYANQIYVWWNDVNCEEQYNVYYSLDNQNFSFLASTTATGMGATNTTANTPYYFRVVPEFSGGSLELDPAIAPSAVGWSGGQAGLAAPTGLNATDGTIYHAIDLSWNAVSGATGYNLYRGSSTWGPWTRILTNYGSTAYQDTNLNYGAGYWYKVAAVSGGVEGALSSYEGGWAGTLVLPP